MVDQASKPNYCFLKPFLYSFFNLALLQTGWLALVSTHLIQGPPNTRPYTPTDNRHQLHIWDLSPLGPPKHMATVRWDPVTYDFMVLLNEAVLIHIQRFMITSPSHNHVSIPLAVENQI